MILIKATKDSEAGVMPDERLLTEMGNFMQAMLQMRKIDIEALRRAYRGD